MSGKALSNVKLASLKEQVKDEKERLNKQIRNIYKKQYRLCDIALLIMILSNIGAFVITNALVVKTAEAAGEEIHFVESNPVMAEHHAFETTPESQLEFFSLITHFSLLLILIVLINYMRFFNHNRAGAYVYFFSVGTYGFILFFDFISNLGYWLGVMF